jgi:hypothetical protein
MQTAQKVITTYRRKRIIVCLLVALLTLTTTLVIRFISQRSLNQQRVQMTTNKMVAAMDKILRPLAEQHLSLLQLVGSPARMCICRCANWRPRCRPCVPSPG